jgi:hypothetical protein
MAKWMTIAFALCAIMLAGCGYGNNRGKSETQPGGMGQVNSNAPGSVNAEPGTQGGAESSTANPGTSNGPSAGAGQTTARDGESSASPGTGNPSKQAAAPASPPGEGAHSGSGTATAPPTATTGQSNGEPPNTTVPQQQQSSLPPVRLGRSQIRELQRALSRQGFDIGPADGILGARTRQGMREFQSRRGMQVTGDPDRNTLAALGLKIPSEKREGPGFASTHPPKSQR